MNQEAAFAKAFIVSEKRARFIQFLADPKRRKEMLQRLSHGLPYIRTLAWAVPGAQDFPDELERLLRAKGAGPNCHVISDGLPIDGKVVPLGEALFAICMHGAGAILCCVPGRLAYYKPESPGQGIILERPQAPA
jgi:hypothetical protein